jgi:hypothetical protein
MLLGHFQFLSILIHTDRLCGLAVRVRFPALPEKNLVGLERGALSLVSTNLGAT